MKRIVLTSVIESYANDYLEELKALTDKPLDRLENLRDLLSQQYYDYASATSTTNQ